MFAAFEEKRKVPLISYAQNFEDVMLWRALGNLQNGFYIDVGAQDPVVDSVSLAFYEQGWRGVHIEPTHHYATLLREHRPGEAILETAVGAEAGIIRFYEIPESGISTADEKIAQQHRERGFSVVEINVPCVTLASVFKSCGHKDVHWLKIDVEGLEEQVLMGWKPSKVRPWIVVVESTLPLTQIESYESWEPLLIGYGYSYVYFDGLNRFYVSNAKKELQRAFRAPPNVFDGFSVSGTASTSVHRVLADRHSKQIENLNAVVVEHAGRERAAVESVIAIKSSAQDELAKSLRAREARETFLREKSEARERELTSILAAAQEESVRRLDLLSQQSVADRSATAAAHDQVKVLQQSLTVREREFADQLTRAREEVDHRLAMARAEFESNARELISANLRETSQREELLQKQIEALRAENQAIVRKLIESNDAHAAQIANVERQAQSAISAQAQTREMREKLLLAEAAAERDAAKRADASATEREQMLVIQARRDIEAAHAELKAQLLQMVDQERMHSENIMRLHEDLRQQLDTQSRSFIERENILRSEFAAQMFSQYGASEENKSAALKREHELSDALNAETRSRDLLEFQLNDIKREVAIAHAHEHELQQEALKLNNALNAETRSRDLLEFQLNDIKREVAIAHAHEHELQQEALNYLQQIAMCQNEISFIRGTFSWRLTSPLRRIAGWIGWRQPQHEMLPDPSGLTSPLLDLTLARATAAASAANPDYLLLARNNIGVHEPSALICYSLENPMANINHVNELLELHDITFVRAAYQSLLGRNSDDAGEGFYLARLRSGIAKADILFEISQSDEGKHISPKLAGVREFVASHTQVRSWGFRNNVVRLSRIEHQVNRLENELARASAGYSQTGKAIQEKLQNLESLLRKVNDANDQRMKQMESTLTVLQHDSDRQILAAVDDRFMSFSVDVGRRFDQVEATVTSMHESVAQQANTIIAAHVDSMKARLDGSVEPPLRYVQKEQLMQEIESWIVTGLANART